MHTGTPSLSQAPAFVTYIKDLRDPIPPPLAQNADLRNEHVRNPRAGVRKQSAGLVSSQADVHQGTVRWLSPHQQEMSMVSFRMPSDHFVDLEFDGLEIAKKLWVSREELKHWGNGPTGDMQLDGVLDPYTGDLVLSLSTYVAGKKEVTTSHELRPRTLRAHLWGSVLVRIRRVWPWLCEHMENRWPVDFERIEVTRTEIVRCCPHNNVSFRSNPGPHHAFIYGPDGEVPEATDFQLEYGQEWGGPEWIGPDG